MFTHEDLARAAGAVIENAGLDPAADILPGYGKNPAAVFELGVGRTDFAGEPVNAARPHGDGP